MKRLIPLVVLLASACTHESTMKAEQLTQLRPRPARPMASRPIVAITVFKNESPDDTVGPPALEICETGLVESEQFGVIDRVQLSKILDENKIQHSGLTDQATAVQVGKMLNAKYLVMGTISNFGSREDKSHVMGLTRSREFILEASVEIKIVDVATALIVAKKSGRGISSLGSTNSVVGGSTVGYDVVLKGKALRGAIFEALDQVIDKME